MTCAGSVATGGFFLFLFIVMRDKPYSPELVRKVRALPILQLLSKMADRHLFYSRRDETFSPVKNGGSVRLHVSSPNGQAWEIIVTAEKWFDVQSRTGGGGCIDLVTFLMGNPPFKKVMAVIVSVISDD